MKIKKYFHMIQSIKNIYLKLSPKPPYNYFDSSTHKHYGQKIFCIGMNKTGTTSLTKTLNDHGLITGDQIQGEWLLDDLINANYEPIIKYCHTAEAFQDTPFSCPGFFKHLDNFFPESKFILTLRDSPEQWFESLCRFHSQIFLSSNPPSIFDLMSFSYIYPGWAYKGHKYIFPTKNIYDRKNYISIYKNHATEVRNYFKNSNKLLCINLREKDAYKKFCSFLSLKPIYETFPHLNKSK